MDDALITTNRNRLAKQMEAAINGVVDNHYGRHWRSVVRELGERSITLADIGKNAKCRGLAEMLDNKDLTLSDLVVLGQYAKAIEDGDTKAATFLRDTAGYKPSVDVTVEHKHEGLASLSDEQLQLLLAAIDDGSSSPCVPADSLHDAPVAVIDVPTSIDTETTHDDTE